MSTTSSTETTVIVVGAGPSGLCTAACLTLNSIPYILLEREDRLAPLWSKKSYDRLHLHLTKEVCSFPHYPIPQNLPKYVPKNDFVQYMEDYAARFGIKPVYSRTVTEAEYDDVVDKKWKVRVKITDGSGEEEVYLGKYLVVASGETSDPYVPEIDGIEGFTGRVIHSTEYKSGKEFRDEGVLVVGSGNSGMEISLDLANHGANTSILIRSPLHIVSRWMMEWGPKLVFKLGLPLKVVDRLMVYMSYLVYGDFKKYGMKRPPDGPFMTKIKYGKYPIIDVGTFQKIRNGEIQVIPSGITKIRGNEVMFEDGKSYAFDAIIFATGFRRSTKNWLIQGEDNLLDENGVPKPSFKNQWKGNNGMYCAGLAGRGLYGAGLDAQKIADDINQQLHQTSSSSLVV